MLDQFSVGLAASSVLLFLTIAPPATAQTPSTTVTNASGDVIFQANDDGGLLAPGEFGTGAIPTEGAGTRLMWDPARAALRAGAVDGTQWDASNVGDYSTAFGQNTTASGPQSMAIGTQTTASGIDAFAAGESAEASGSAAVAFGTNTQASSDNVLAAGQCNQLAGPGDLLLVGDGQLDIVSGDCQDRSNALRLTDVGNMTIGNDLTAGGSVFANDFLTTSDRRLKTNVTPLADSVLASLTELRPVRFQFKASTGHSQRPEMGFIAQEVQQEFPSLVRAKDDGTLALAYPKLTAVLAKGIQEQQAQIDALKQRTQRLDEMEQQIAALRTEVRHPRTAGWTDQIPLRSLTLVLIGGLLGAGLVRWGHR